MIAVVAVVAVVAIGGIILFLTASPRR